MQTILIAGAGKSAVFLIDYLLKQGEKYNWKVIIADGNAAAVAGKAHGYPGAETVILDITDAGERQALVRRADIVLSLMPPHLHILLAKDCLQFKKHLITASYVSPEIREMEEAVRKAGLMFMCEMGLDPGIDHMTASEMIFGIRRVGGEILSFKSYCGGLVAPESDNNPWHYKITWNPRNVVNAGKDGAVYLLEGENKFIGYQDIFRQAEMIEVEGHAFAAYANRDSLSYLPIYDTDEVRTFLRATLRHPDFCRGWQAMVDLGFTDHTDQVENIATYADWVKAKTAYQGDVALRDHIIRKAGISGHVADMIAWLGILDEKPVTLSGMHNASSADILLEVLLHQWKMEDRDKDMVVMQHEIVYRKKNMDTSYTSSMILKGEGGDHSAMAKTVGLPMGILATFTLSGKVPVMEGVHIPNNPAVYRPVLKELRKYGIHFTDHVK